MHSPDDYDIETLRYHLKCKKYSWDPQRWRRLQQAGRVVEVPGLLPPASRPVSSTFIPAITQQSPVLPKNSLISRQLRNLQRLNGRKLLARTWSFVEIVVVIGMIITILGFWRTQSGLNQELSQIQRTQSQGLALPTPTHLPLIDVVVLPGGHKPPAPGQLPQPGEAGNIPVHLLPALNAYQAPPIPTPFPEQARRIQIPAIDVDSPIVQGMYDWEQLKKGVAQKIGSAAPGQIGNTALAGHNDIYGEVFRYLDKLSPGDEIIISTEINRYTYIIRETKIVEPTETWVLQPTDYAATTLISCYPYRVNTQRIVVFADLVATEG